MKGVVDRPIDGSREASLSHKMGWLAAPTSTAISTPLLTSYPIWSDADNYPQQ